MANFFKDGERSVVDRIYDVIFYPFKKLYNIIKTGFLKIRAYHFEKNPEVEKKARERRISLFSKMRELKRKLIELDKQTAARIIHTINMIDRRNDSIAQKAADAVSIGNEKFDLAREWAELNKKKLLSWFAYLVIILFMLAAFINYGTAYEYSYNGKVLGVVRNQDDVIKIVDIIASKLSKEHEADIYIDVDKDIKFKRVFGLVQEIDDSETVLDRMTYMKDMLAHGTGIYIDDKLATIVDSRETAGKVLEDVKLSFMPGGRETKYEETGFVEKVETKDMDTKLGLIQDRYEAVAKIISGGEKKASHKVVPGETLLSIARMYAMSMEQIKEANPGIDPEQLYVGEEILLSKAAPMLTVQTVEISNLTEDLQYPVEYQENSSVYEGESRVLVKGVPGTRSIIAKIVKNNGEEVSRLELESIVTRQPVKEVVQIGTKKLPPKQGTGTFIYPVSGARLTSGFGRRWGGFHRGIDLACPTGTIIRASDGGTVKFAGYSGSYGYVVKIDHGGGFLTVYAHCSRLAVRAGEKVYQGQYIANVGSTGRSTGPHCHFEIQYFGKVQNPLNYL